MRKGMTKEQAVFLAGALLFVWVMVKLGIFLTRSSTMPTTPQVAAGTVQSGDKRLSGSLETGGLATYLGRGSRDPFFPSTGEPASIFFRVAVSHSLLTSSFFSRYSFDCRMVPASVKELRFKLSPRATVADVFCKELDPARQWGVDEQTLVVPVLPVAVKRSLYRCSVTVVVRGHLVAPGPWTAPTVTATDVTPADVQCEVGVIAVATPGDHLEIAPPADPRVGNLTRIALDALPKDLAAQSNKLAFDFKRPDYALTLDLTRKGASTVALGPTVKPTVVPTVKPTKPPTVRPTNPPTVAIEEPKPEPLAIPKVGDAETLPFKLTTILRIDDPEPRRQAVLRNKESGENLRKFEGEIVMGDLRVASITDDAVVIQDSKGKIYKFRGRFGDKYNE